MATAAMVRVGELACQRNSFLRDLTATVVSCEPAKPAAGAGKKKGAAEAATYDVVLSDSVLFPEGGGQPCDYGTLSWGSADSTVAITNVTRRGDVCVLSSPVPVPVGETVVERVDWPRRLDHMQHHTAQHLLTAIVEREDTMHLPTISWSLTHPFCFIQLDLAPYLEDTSSPYHQYITADKKICDAMVEKIQSMCNAEIARGVPVQCDIFDTREAYEAEQERRQAEEAGKDGAEEAFRSRGIPLDVTGPIRIISLDGGSIDSCTCCGTHLTHLSQLHLLQLLHQEIKGTTVKLHFTTGQRAIDQFTAMYGRERSLITELGGTRPGDFIATVQRRSKDSTELEKKMKRWTLELAASTASALIAAHAAQPSPVLTLRRDDVDQDFFNAVRTQLNEAGLSSVVLVAAWAIDCSAAAAANTIVPKKDVQGQIFVSGAQQEVITKVADIAKETMEGLKGGVSKQGFRGKGSLKEWAKLVETLKTFSA